MVRLFRNNAPVDGQGIANCLLCEARVSFDMVICKILLIYVVIP